MKVAAREKFSKVLDADATSISLKEYNHIPEPHWEGVTNVFSEALEEMGQKKESKLTQVVVEIWPESQISIFTMG